MYLMHSRCGPFFSVVMLASAVHAQPAAEPSVADLVRVGTVRVGVFPPEVSKNAAGQLVGVGVDIAHALASRIGVRLELVELRDPADLLSCLKARLCDAGLIGMTSSRAEEVDFSPPVRQNNFSYLVPAGSEIRSVLDADRPTVRIAAVRNHASTAALARALKQAKIIHADILDEAFDLLRSGKVEVFASTRSALADYLVKLPDSRVLADNYGANVIAVAVPKRQSGWLAYVSEFVEEAKASGLVQRAMDRHGRGGTLASPGSLPK